MNDPRFHGMDSQEMIDLQFAMKDSRRQAMMDEDMRRQSFSNRSSGAGGSGTTSTGMQYGPPSMPSRTSSLREQSKSRRSVEEDIRAMDPYAFRSQAATQKKLNTPSLKENFKKVGRAIGKWMMFNAISFNAADSGPYYQVMIDIIAEYGKGVKGPSGRQLAGEFLQFELDDLTKYIKDLRIKWPEYGCTIMCDGWSSRNRHPIVNFMVYCKGDMMFHKSVDATNKKKTAEYIYSLMKNVVEVIGKDNVVQIVTDNESSYKAAGKKMMKKYPNLFWSPCAAHCIDLMLEDIGDIPSVASLVRDAKKITSFIYGSNQLVEMMRTYTNGRELLRPGITRFATEFIAIESLIRHKSDLKIMFASTEWRELSYVRHRKREDQATEVSGIVLGQQFWKRAEQMVAAMEPLVLVLKIVDQEKKPTMPVIYDAMDRAKLGIKDSQVKEWKKIWDIIDSRWERQLHCHLHAAAYFLNPISRYGQNFSYDTEVRLGLKEVIKRLEPNVTNQAMALTEESIFSERRGSFGSSLAQKSITLQSAAEWWYHHGEDAPNLRKIALKVLSQTCSSSGCERNWSTFSLIHTKIRNRLAIQKLEMLVFVHYNLRLRVRSLIVTAANDPEYCPIDLNHIFDDQDILDPWIVETEPPLLDGTDEQWLENGLEDFATTQGRRQQEQTSSSRAKQKSPVYEVSEPSSPDSSGNDSDNGNGSNAGSHEMQSGSHDVSDDNDPTYAARRTWEQGYDQYYATQDTDHGNRVGIDAQRDHLNRVAGFPSQTSSDEHEHSRRSTGTFMETTNFGQHVVLPYTGYPQPYPQPFPGGEAPYLQRSFSTGPTSRRESSRSRPSAPPLPLLPPASPYVPQPPSRWSRLREKSTSTSSGGYYDRQCSGSQSNQERGGSESSSSFGPTGHGYDHGWESATPSASYVRDPSLSTGEDSSQSQSQTNNQSHDYGSDLASSLFSFPQAQFYGQSSFGEGFEPHRRSYWH